MTARIASAKPTWASCGVATRSPTANTPAPRSASTRPRGRTALVDLDPRALGQEPVRERTAADRHQDRLDLEPFPVLEDDGGVVAAGLVAGDRDTGPHGDPAFGERTDDHVGHVLVAPGQDLGQGLQKLSPARRDRPASRRTRNRWPRADHRHRARQLAQVQQLVGGQDVAAVHVETGKGPRDRTGGEHDVAPGEGVTSPPAGGDLDGLACEQPSHAREDRDLALAQQAREPFVELVDDPVLAVLADARTRRRAGSPGCRTPWPPRRCGTPPPSRGTPSRAHSPGAGRCRRPCPSRRRPPTVPRPPRKEPWRSRPARHR